MFCSPSLSCLLNRITKTSGDRGPQIFSSRAAWWPALPYPMGLIDSPLYRRCGTEEKTSAHVLCEGDTLATLRHNVFGFPFLEPWGCQKYRSEGGGGQSGTLWKGQGSHYSISVSGAQRVCHLRVSGPKGFEPITYWILFRPRIQRLMKLERRVPKSCSLSSVARNYAQWLPWTCLHCAVDKLAGLSKTPEVYARSVWRALDLSAINRSLNHRSRLEERHLAPEFRFRTSGCDLHCGVFVLFHSCVYCGSTAYFWTKHQTFWQSTELTAHLDL